MRRRKREECTWPAGSRMLVQCSGRRRGSCGAGARCEQPVSGPHILFRQLEATVEPKLPLTLQLDPNSPSTFDQGTTSGQMRYNLPSGCCTAVPGVGKQMAGQAATSEPYQMRGAGGGGPGGAGWPGAPGQGRRPRGQGEARAVAAVERAVRIGGGGRGQGWRGRPRWRGLTRSLIHARAAPDHTAAPAPRSPGGL